MYLSPCKSKPCAWCISTVRIGGIIKFRFSPSQPAISPEHRRTEFERSIREGKNIGSPVGFLGSLHLTAFRDFREVTQGTGVMLQSRFQPIPAERGGGGSEPADTVGTMDSSSNYRIAELLMDIKRIAGDEMRGIKDREDVAVTKKPASKSSTSSRRVTMMMPPTTKLRSRPSILAPAASAIITIPSSTFKMKDQPLQRMNPRSRLVSLDYGDSIPACVTPETSPRLTTIGSIGELAMDSSCFLLSQDTQPISIKTSSSSTSKATTSAATIVPHSTISNKHRTGKNSSSQQQPVAPNKKKKNAVGRTLHDGVQWKGTLRKKFSWKSFPELELYLVDNRAQYLEYSNSLNYTKAQKIYNNKLTQGLLDLAASEGYTFEGFSFAAVRDRIRCFYKSYVQATKKKKRATTKRSS
jgi:hypothetical protein